MSDPADPYLDSRMPLTPSDAVAAIVVLDDGRYVLQHRDPLPGIFYPDHWGFFGGAVEAGEEDAQALSREIEEELGWQVAASELRYFTSFTFDFGFAGHPVMRRVFYALTGVPAGRAIELGEGQSVRAFDPRSALAELKLTPYDSFALWLHAFGGARMARGAA
jgi:8-oxo-dGTP pyrophosphatase MutT (NUDIX family)